MKQIYARESLGFCYNLFHCDFSIFTCKRVVIYHISCQVFKKPTNFRLKATATMSHYKGCRKKSKFIDNFVVKILFHNIMRDLLLNKM